MPYMNRDNGSETYELNCKNITLPSSCPCKWGFVSPSCHSGFKQLLKRKWSWSDRAFGHFLFVSQVCTWCVSIHFQGNLIFMPIKAGLEPTALSLVLSKFVFTFPVQFYSTSRISTTDLYNGDLLLQGNQHTGLCVCVLCTCVWLNPNKGKQQHNSLIGCRGSIENKGTARPISNL